MLVAPGHRLVITTIMLWIGGQVTAANTVTSIMVPSIVCMIVPLICLTFKLKGNIQRPSNSEVLEHIMNPTSFERNSFFFRLRLLFVLFSKL